jgi:hypothetical protein
VRSRATTNRNYVAVFGLILSLFLVFFAQSSVIAGDYVRTATGKEHEVYAFNQPRGPNQLIVYTSSYGNRTGTNPWGAEAVVKNGTVVEIRQGFLTESSDSPIPENGFVLSGHGTAKQWLNSNLKKGMEVELIQKGRTKVGVLVSGYNLAWYNQMGLESPDWAFFDEMKNLVNLVRNRGYKVVPLSDKDLEQTYKSEQEVDRKPFAKLEEIKTLILPNTRRLSREEIRSLKRYVGNGGTILAIMQASLRNASDKKVGNGDYQLDDLLGVTYDSFSWKRGRHTYIGESNNHEIWRGIDGMVRNERGWAMVNGSTSEGKVLGVWYDSNEEPSHSRDRNAAIVEGNRTLYVGEQLLAPENYENEEARRLLGNMIDYLYNLKPSAGERVTVSQDAQPNQSPTGEATQKSEGGFDTLLWAGVGAVAIIAGYIFLS